jgi:mRNA-degrading endonuclease toxin of MazEF toxin-antitoxin module
VAEVTTNLAGASDPANLLIEIATPEGQATGLKTDSLVTCLHLVTMTEERIKQVIGTLSPDMLSRLNDCLKVALELT